MMRLSGAIRQTAAIVAAFGLAACATADQRPPLLTLDQRACNSAPDIATATPVLLDADTPAKMMMETDAPCSTPTDGVKQVYGLFKLPESATPFLLDVISVPLGRTLFSPQVAFLDAQGVETRGISADRFVFRGDQLSLGLRPTANERYLLVTSNAALVGQNADHLVGGTQAQMIYVGVGVMMMNTGVETTRQLTHAYNGMITVAARPMPTAN